MVKKKNLGLAQIYSDVQKNNKKERGQKGDI